MNPQPAAPRRSFPVWLVAAGLALCIAAVAFGVVHRRALGRHEKPGRFMEDCTQSCRPAWQAAAGNADPGNPFRGISDEQVGAICQCVCAEGRKQLTPEQRERLEESPEAAKQDAELGRALSEGVGRAAGECVPRVVPGVKKPSGAGE